MIATWQGTRLWKRLEQLTDDASENAKILLLNPLVMDKIEKILSKGGTSPIDFTLHDEDHASRVAERMVDIIPPQTFEKLSGYDIMMLLLSAYLHDIGMTPEAEKVNNHYQILIGAKKDLLTEDELKEFQKWLDLESIGVNLKSDSLNDLTKAQEVTAYYSRYKHNAWSEEWINKNLRGIELPRYNRWQIDLINICKSHHYGYEFLIQEKFDPRSIATIICHRRYVAMCLRMADVIEIDPERTPSVILKHRGVSQKSIPYWLKDQEIEISISDGKVRFYARPQAAFLYKAIIETVEQIEQEIVLCNQLNAQRPVNTHTVIKDDFYRWNVVLYSIDVKPFEDSFSYINGSFRPNVNKVLDLLGGKELYGDNIVAIREIIQNSFDAIRERIAYKRITNGLIDSSWQEQLGEEYKVSLVLLEDTEGHWLVCKDQGVGMTKSLIENYFLVSGSSQKHKVLELMRKCLELNIEFDRTGQFGIGVLSFFMIADKIVIRTKRAQDTGYSETDLIGWQFSIDGIQEFGELVEIPIEGSGTEIRLLLKTNVFDDKTSIGLQIATYLEKILIKTPCQFEFIYTSNGVSIVNIFGNGWVFNEKKFCKEFSSKNTVKNYESFPFSHQDALSRLFYDPTALEEDDTSYQEDMQSRIHVAVLNAQLPAGLGSFRVFVPYFQLDEGYSFCYSKGYWINDSYKLENTNYSFILDSEHVGSRLTKASSFSWKGIAVKSEGADFYSLLFKDFLYEIDLVNSSSVLSVNREKIEVFDAEWDKISGHINNQVQKFLVDLMADKNQGIWKLYNTIYSKSFQSDNFTDSFWFFHSSKEGDFTQLKRIDSPLGISYSFDDSGKYKISDEIIDVSISGFYNRSISSRYFISKEISLHPMRKGKNKLDFGVIMKSVDGLSYSHDSDFLQVSFPKDWKQFIGFTEYFDRHDRIVYLNSSYFNIEFLDHDETKELRRLEPLKLTHVDFFNEAHNNINLAQEVIFNLIFSGNEYWKNVQTKHRNELLIIWKMVFGDQEEVFKVDSDMSIEVISVDSRRSISNIKEVSKYFPDAFQSDFIYKVS